MESIEDKVRKYIADNILFTNNYPYTDDTSFLENGVVDSMNVMELVAYVEDSFGVDVADSEIVPANFDSVKNLCGYLHSKGL
jgi:acyl carrier protein